MTSGGRQPPETGDRRRRRGPLVGVLAGHTISLTGNMLTLVALPLYVLATTESVTRTGVVAAVSTVPVVLGGALGGTVVDRIGYRRASVVADLVSAVTIVAVPMLHSTVGLPLWALLTLVFLSGLLDTPGQAARSALLPDAARLAGVPLERAVGLFDAAERAARLAGAPVAGFLVALLGPLTVLAVDAATFVVSALLVAVLLPGVGVRDSRSAMPEDGYWRQLGAGVQFLVRAPLLRAIVVLVLFTNLFDAAYAGVLLPVAAVRELGGPVVLGLLIGVTGGGSLAGSLLYGMIGHRLPRRPTFVASFFVAGGPPMLAVAAGLPVPVLVVVTALASFASGTLNPIINIMKLTLVPPTMLASVTGMIRAGAWAAMPIGPLAAGLAADRFGVTTVLVVLGLAFMLVSLAPLAGGVWRDMDAVAAPADETPPTGTASAAASYQTRQNG